MSSREEKPPACEGEDLTRTAKRALWVLGALAAVAAVALGAVYYTNPLGLDIWYRRWSLTRAGLTKEEIPAPGGPLTVWTGGKGKTLVLVHSVGDQAGTWSAVVPGLLRRYRLVIPDLPGHGESEPRKGELTLRGSLDGLAAAVRERGGEEPVILVGNALGGWLALAYAREHPERVERLVLVSSVGLSFNLGGVPLVPRDRGQAQRFWDALFGPDTPPASGFLLDDLIEKTWEGPLPRLLANLRALDLLDDRLPEVRTPADLIWGEADGIVPREVMLRLLNGLPAARLHTIPRCGHLPQQECPEAFEELLLKALASPPLPMPAPFSSLP